MLVRSADKNEIDGLAVLWHDGWQDGHARIVPAELARQRTLDSFRSRLIADLSLVRVAGPPGQPLGFCIAQDDEIQQLYVSASARGTGVATALLIDSEQRLRARGVHTAWLACAIGNERAGRFYEKNGWRRVDNMISQLPTADGVFPLEVWRFEKGLNDEARPAVAVAHVVLETDRMEETSHFMRVIGMRPIFDGPEVSVYEMRGATHLVMMRKDHVATGDAPFDLMVDDLRGTHERFTAAGLSPSPIEARPAVHHDVFTVREPAGHVITIYSSHASGKPV